MFFNIFVAFRVILAVFLSSPVSTEMNYSSCSKTAFPELMSCYDKFEFESQKENVLDLEKVVWKKMFQSLSFTIIFYLTEMLHL